MAGRRLGVVSGARGLPGPRPLRRGLDNNHLTGSIPASFSKLTSLEDLCALLACCACLVSAPACVCVGPCLCGCDALGGRRLGVV